MRKQTGFTLLELMVTVVIVAILATIAYPSYVDYSTRGKLAEARAELMQARAKLEQFYQDNRTYAGGCPSFAGTKYFTYTCPTLSASAYELQADGVGSLAGFKFTIDQAGVRKTTGVGSGWTLPSSDCWVVRKDGSC